MPKRSFILTIIALALIWTAAPLRASKASTDRTAYFRSRIDMALDSARQGHAYRAILMANATLTEMEEEKYENIGMIYAAMGSIFQMKANYHLAEHYFLLALDNTSLNNVVERMERQSQLATLLKLWKPSEALRYNQEYASTNVGYPLYRQRYLFVNAVANFALGNAEEYAEASKAYQDYMNEKSGELTAYGQKAIEAMNLATEGQYGLALQLLKSPSEGLSDLDCSDLRTLIFQRMGDFEAATRQLQSRIQLTDSLGSMLLFENMSEISTKDDIDKTRQQAHQQRNTMLYIILALALLLIAFMTFSILRFRASRSRLKEKNTQLAAALAMAEESDKMKRDFVRNVSHEIRTPLNAINGFNEILNNYDAPLTKEERADLVGRINENTNAIISIVNELLEMAKENSEAMYNRFDTIFCNQFFSQLTYQFRQQISSKVELRYTTKVINRFKIVTNQEALSQVMEHLIQNAIKFTKEGSITVNCSEAGNLLLVSVTDTGQGVAPDMQDTIFSPFAKANTFKQGIGLGLSVSRKIAQRLGGDLILDKQYTDGARFILSLPVDY